MGDEIRRQRCEGLGVVFKVLVGVTDVLSKPIEPEALLIVFTQQYRREKFPSMEAYTSRINSSVTLSDVQGWEMAQKQSTV